MERKKNNDTSPSKQSGNPSPSLADKKKHNEEKPISRSQTSFSKK